MDSAKHTVSQTSLWFFVGHENILEQTILCLKLWMKSILSLIWWLYAKHKYSYWGCSQNNPCTRSKRSETLLINEELISAITEMPVFRAVSNCSENERPNGVEWVSSESLPLENPIFARTMHSWTNSPRHPQFRNCIQSVDSMAFRVDVSHEFTLHVQMHFVLRHMLSIRNTLKTTMYAICSISYISATSMGECR